MRCYLKYDSFKRSSDLVQFSKLTDYYWSMIGDIDFFSHCIGQTIFRIVLCFIVGGSWKEIVFANVFEFLLFTESVALLLALTEVNKIFVMVGIRRRYKRSTRSESFLSGEWVSADFYTRSEHSFGKVIGRLCAARWEKVYYEFLGCINL